MQEQHLVSTDTRHKEQSNPFDKLKEKFRSLLRRPRDGQSHPDQALPTQEISLEDVVQIIDNASNAILLTENTNLVANLASGKSTFRSDEFMAQFPHYKTYGTQSKTIPGLLNALTETQLSTIDQALKEAARKRLDLPDSKKDISSRATEWLSTHAQQELSQYYDIGLLSSPDIGAKLFQKIVLNSTENQDTDLRDFHIDPEHDLEAGMEIGFLSRSRAKSLEAIVTAYYKRQAVQDFDAGQPHQFAPDLEQIVKIRTLDVDESTAKKILENTKSDRLSVIKARALQTIYPNLPTYEPKPL